MYKVQKICNEVSSAEGDVIGFYRKSNLCSQSCPTGGKKTRYYERGGDSMENPSAAERRCLHVIVSLVLQKLVFVTHRLHTSVPWFSAAKGLCRRDTYTIVRRGHMRAPTKLPPTIYFEVFIKVSCSIAFISQTHCIYLI